MYRVKLTPSASLKFRNLHPTIRKQLKAILKELDDKQYLGKKLEDELA